MLLISNSSYLYSVPFVHCTQPVEMCTRDNHRLKPRRRLQYNRQMKQNNSNVSDFAEKIASVDGPETEIIIKCGILRIEAIFI